MSGASTNASRAAVDQNLCYPVLPPQGPCDLSEPFHAERARTGHKDAKAAEYERIGFPPDGGNYLDRTTNTMGNEMEKLILLFQNTEAPVRVRSRIQEPSAPTPCEMSWVARAMSLFRLPTAADADQRDVIRHICGHCVVDDSHEAPT